MDSADSRWLQQTSRLRDNPLEHNLGFFDFGRYHKANPGSKHAFEKVGELMGFELESGSDSEDEDDSEEHEDATKGRKDSTEPRKDAAREEPTAMARDQQADVLRVTAGNKIDTTCPETPATLRKRLAKETVSSKDKLFLLKRTRHSHKLASWHLVQVDEDETNWRRAKTEGVHHVRFFVRCYADSKKKKVKECAYWPKTHEFKRDGETMGPIVPTKPTKVDHLLSTKSHRYMWYHDTINLFDCMIAGPFDFVDGYHVPTTVWNKLLSDAEQLQVYVGAVNRIVPLDKPDRMDKDEEGDVSSHLALRWNIFNGTELS